MLKRKIHMQDQIPNRIDIVMQESRIPFMQQLEEISIAVLLVAVFLVGVNF